MLKIPLRLVRGRQKGITGLETAIILISFVVIASIFAYVVISAGLFSTQKSKEAIYKGINEAKSTTTLKGGVVAIADQEDGNVQQITFTLSNAMGGEPMDFTPPEAAVTNNGRAGGNLKTNKVVISYIDEYQKIDDLYWTLTKSGYDDGDNLLDEQELFQITIGSDTANTAGGNLLDALTVHPLEANDKFTIQVTTPKGSTLIFERTLPGYIDTVMNLH
jgi:flagellin FlaB